VNRYPYKNGNGKKERTSKTQNNLLLVQKGTKQARNMNLDLEVAFLFEWGKRGDL